MLTETVSITAATQPGLEDVVLGAIPGLLKVHLHNPVSAYENSDDFLKYWEIAEKGQLEPFVLIVERSIRNLASQSRPRSGLTALRLKLSRSSAPGSSVRPFTRAATAPVIPSREISPRTYSSSKCIVKLGCWGPVVDCNVPKGGMDERDGRAPERRWHLYWWHDTRISGQIHAFYGRAARGASLRWHDRRVRSDNGHFAPSRMTRSTRSRGGDILELS